ncbi:MAG: hypothetical protein SFZ24_09625 [Planctomycetota bacterium]|nr:hypothetical protein [Planctomycetota bacterium]
MSSGIVRKLIPEALIGLSACVGVSLGLTDPMQRRLDELRAAESQARSAAAQLDRDRLRRELLERLSRVEAVARRSANAQDETTLFAALTLAADQAGVELRQLQGRDVGAASTRVGGRTLGYTISGSAPYHGAVQLLASLASPTSFTMIESVEIRPAGDTAHPIVDLTINTRHDWFDADPARRAIAHALDLLEAEATP